MRHIAILILLFLIIGCEDYSTKRTFVEASTRPDLSEFVLKSDETAEKILKEFNGSKWAEELGEGPFQLNDYTRSLTVDTDPINHRPIVIVIYRLQKPISIRGHPQHFSVWVYKDTGKTEWFGGR